MFTSDRTVLEKMRMRSEAGERRVYIAVGLVAALLLLAYLVYEISAVVLVILMTLLFSTIISGPVDYLQKKGISRGLGTLIVFLGLLLFFVGVGSLLAPAIEDQATQFAETIPSLLQSTQSYLTDLRDRFGLDFSLPLDQDSIVQSVRNFLSGGVLSTVANFGAGIANIVSLGAVVLIAALYSVLRPAPIVNGFVALFPAEKRPRVREILYSMYSTVQRWFLGQLISMLIIGTLWTIGLLILGIPFALLLGLLSALLAFIPYLGAAISVIPPFLIALVEDPILAVWVLVVYFGIQAVESYLIQPIVMSHAVDLHPAVVVFTILIMGTLFGIVGVFIAVPLTAAVVVLVNELWVSRMDILGTDPDPPHRPEKGKGPPLKERLLRTLSRVSGLRRRS